MARKGKGKESNTGKGSEVAEATDGDGSSNSDLEAAQVFEPTNRLRFVGLALIGSLIIGYSPLRDAIQGNGPFENAMFRFLACFVVCISAASILGRILDGVPRESEVGAQSGAGHPASVQTDLAAANETEPDRGPDDALDRSPVEASD